jgi:multidrug efflux pump subunit AcrA (membrane-fusion protein)
VNQPFNQTDSAHDGASSSIDLSQLATTRRPSTDASIATKSRRRWFTRYLLPLGIVSTFAGLFAWAARETFLPAHSVTIVPVIVTRAEVQQEGTPLFQAAGWIEPRPTPVVVSSLAGGVVKELLVVEGQIVEKGQSIATLIDTDAKIEIQKAEANVKLCSAEIQIAAATLTAARITLQNPNELKARLADAESNLSETKLTLGNLPYAIEAAKTRYQLAADNVARKQQAGEAIAGRLLREAKAELAAAESALAELKARGPSLSAQVDALDRKRAALNDQFSLMNDQKRAVAEAEAAVIAANARREQAMLALDAARLNLQRMTICAPISGRVLTVDTRPGRRLVGLDPLGQQDSSTVISMYDPKKLQVRVDVRLEDVPNVQIGQSTTIETAALKKPFQGEVLWVTTRADVQKNTLQVKVAIHDPADVITPEMLGQVTFLAPRQASAASDEKQQPLRMMIPSQLVSGADSGSSVWVVDVTGKIARQVSIQLGRAKTDQLIEVTSGLTPTDKLVVGGRESLAEGSRVRIVGEDQLTGQSARVAVQETSRHKK